MFPRLPNPPRLPAVVKKHHLPQAVLLAAEYRQRGVSYQILATKYGCSAGTVRNQLRAWANGIGEPWPLKSDTQTRGQNRDTVPAALVVAEVQYACSQLRITQSSLARLAGLNPNHLHKITSGKVTTIERTTQGKILEAISQIESGEVEHEPQKVILPMPIRDRCPAGHPYTGLVSPTTGRKFCRQCRVEKDRRRSALTFERRAAERELAATSSE